MAALAGAYDDDPNEPDDLRRDSELIQQLLDLILRQAIKERAERIRIVPFPDGIRLTFIIDGHPVETSPYAPASHRAILNRLRQLCKSGIDDSQGSRGRDEFMMKLDDVATVFRVQIEASPFGERAVIDISRLQ